MTAETLFRDRVPAPPEGRDKLKWYGPGLLWMLSAVGTGSILFTPRVASVYQYELLWLLLVVVFFMWVMIREMARYSIVTGHTMLEGMHELAGPRDWAVWLIFVPQLVAAAVGIAGLAAITGSALAAFLPGGNTLHAVLMVMLCVAFTATGRYMRIEALSRAMALILMLMAVLSALIVLPSPGKVLAGLQPRWPENPDLYVMLPWIGTILAGSMGIVWFGYWTATRGYGGGLAGRERDDEMPEQTRREQHDTEARSHTRELRMRRTRAWMRVMSGTATLGVAGGFVVILSFMVLGSELLAPRTILPEGPDVAVDLTRLFSGIWGAAGQWLLLAAIVVALGGSILANQDGWGRSFADMTLILIRGKRRSKQRGWAVETLDWIQQHTNWPMFERRSLKRFYILAVTGVIPVAILIVFQDPVEVMSASGIIAAAQ